MNILLSAFACEPNRGSEPGVGWNWAVNLAKNHNVYVITRKKSKEAIEKYLVDNPVENLHFYYFEGNKIMRFIDLKIPFGFRLYYRWWQKKIVPIATKVINNSQISVMQQLTYNEFRTPGKLYNLDRPFIWGPIGGGHEYNPVLKRAYFRTKDVIIEKLRNKINHFYLNNKDVTNALKRAVDILVADPATYRILPKNRNYIRLLETAYYPDRNKIKDYNTSVSSRAIRLMYAGGLIPRKGLKLIIEALGESDFRDFEFILIGNGKDKKLLEQLVKKYQLQDHIRFLGELSYDEVNRYYDWADLFLFPSLRDTSGNVMVEAMSHGTPVIALNHNGASEMITEESGELISIDSYNQIKQDYIEAIKKYYHNAKLLEEKGTAARNRIEKVYSWDHVMDFMENVYNNAVAKYYKKLELFRGEGMSK